MRETNLPSEKDLRGFLRQIKSPDQRLIQKHRIVGTNDIVQLKCVEARCINENLGTSKYARGQAAAKIIIDIILNLQQGSSSDQLLAHLIVEHCVKGRRLEIAGQERGYSRSQS